MQKENKKFLYIGITFVLIFLITLSSLFSLPNKAYANDDYIDFDESNVLDDLESSENFKLEDFPFDASGRYKQSGVINVVEWAYGVRDKSDFALYVYFYNPQAYLINELSVKNKIQIATTYNTEVINKVSEPTRYEQFNLLYINKSERANYEGLFYKFRVIDKTDSTGKKILADRVYTNERRYDISGITLSTRNGDKEFGIANTYYFSGYASGYGADETAESTLTGYCESLETISLEVKSGFYRPQGYSSDTSTRDQLHFVYFAVPNSYISKYGEMVAVHATWLNAVLKPALVVGNQEVYNGLLPYLGQTNLSNLNYGLCGKSYLDYTLSMAGITDGAVRYIEGYSYNIFESKDGLSDEQKAKYIDALYLMFNSGSGIDSADSYTVSGNEFLTAMQNYSNGRVKNINGTYSSDLFSQVDSKFTDVNLTNDKEYVNGEYKEYELSSKTITQSFWQSLVGKYSLQSSDTFNGIKCIEAVNDFSYNKENDCAKYFIDKSCYDDFKSYYDSKKALNTIYIFRYKISPYISEEATSFKFEERTFFQRIIKSMGKDYADIETTTLDTNAYFFQESVDIGFDIIDITFKNNDNYYVIPVVSDPLDIVYTSSVPVITTSDKTIVKRVIDKITAPFDNASDQVSGFFSKVGAWAVLFGGVVLGLILLFIWYKLFVINIQKAGNWFLKILMILLTILALVGIAIYGYYIYNVIIGLGGLK